MLAYVFWHRPTAGIDAGDYERDQDGFHRSLAARPPDGFRGSACLRAPELPWLDAAGLDDSAGYEDWYMVDDWAALGVLRQAAVAGGHRTAHDRAARRFGAGTASVMRLCEGAAAPAAARLAVWVSVSGSPQEVEIAGLLLGDGMDADAGLWRRELALGPAPEYCVLGVTEPAGVGKGRLPASWSARSYERTAVPADLRS